jgi:large subunit ribosomal protein L4
LNKKLKQLARKSALSEKAAENVITVVEDFTFEAPRTKAMIEVMKNLKVDGKKLLVVLAQSNLIIEKSARNLQNVKVVNAADLNTYDVLNCTNIVMAEGALNVINEMFSIA